MKIHLPEIWVSSKQTSHKYYPYLLYVQHILIISAIGGIAIFLAILYRKTRDFPDDVYVIKYRGDKILSTQMGGKVKLVPIRDSIYTLDTNGQEIFLRKHIMIDDKQNTVEIVGKLVIDMKEPEKFAELIDSSPTEDITHSVLSIIKQRIFRIIKTDIWGRSKIDLMKNEKRTITRLKDNIIYNLELLDDEVIEFHLEFLLD